MSATRSSAAGPRRAGRRRPPRRGLTLFELLLALAIFLASLAALSYLIAAGTRAAVGGRLQGQAVLRCQAKMAEIEVGAEPLEAVSDIRFADDDRWRWSATVVDGSWPELKQVAVTVSHAGENALGNVSFTLRKLVRDPGAFQYEPPPRAAPAGAPPPVVPPDEGGRDEPQEDSDR